MILLTLDSAIEILNAELDKVALWFDYNKLTFNINKTQMIMIMKAKFHGVIVDQHLNWKNHFSMISQKNPSHAA